MRWSSLPDELLQCIVQSLLELSPASLATFSRLERRSHALTRQRLANMERLRLPPFRLSGQEILGGLRTFNGVCTQLTAQHNEVFACALESGALASLEELKLHRNNIGDRGMSALASACANGALPQLEKLWLGRNSIGDAGLSALADVVSRGALAQLTTLGLAQNQVGDTGLSSLAAAVGNGALNQLQVCWRPSAL